MSFAQVHSDVMKVMFENLAKEFCDKKTGTYNFQNASPFRNFLNCMYWLWLTSLDVSLYVFQFPRKRWMSECDRIRALPSHKRVLTWHDARGELFLRAVYCDATHVHVGWTTSSEPPFSRLWDSLIGAVSSDWPVREAVWSIKSLAKRGHSTLACQAAISAPAIRICTKVMLYVGDNIADVCVLFLTTSSTHW